jgi:hypothetical protein
MLATNRLNHAAALSKKLCSKNRTRQTFRYAFFLKFWFGPYCFGRWGMIAENQI